MTHMTILLPVGDCEPRQNAQIAPPTYASLYQQQPVVSVPLDTAVQPALLRSNSRTEWSLSSSSLILPGVQHLRSETCWCDRQGTRE